MLPTLCVPAFKKGIFSVVEQPLSLRDLASSAYYLFPTINDLLSGNHFATGNDVNIGIDK